MPVVSDLENLGRCSRETVRLTFDPGQAFPRSVALETKGRLVADRPAKRVTVRRRFPEGPPFAEKGNRGGRAELDEDAIPVLRSHGRLADESKGSAGSAIPTRGILASDESQQHRDPDPVASGMVHGLQRPGVVLGHQPSQPSEKAIADPDDTGANVTRDK